MDRKLEQIPIEEISQKAVDIATKATKLPNNNITISIAQVFSEAALTALFKSFGSRFHKKPATMCVVHPEMLFYLDTFEDIVFREDTWHLLPPLAIAGKLVVPGQTEKVTVIRAPKMPLNTAVIFNDTSDMTFIAHPSARHEKHDMNVACCRPTGYCQYCGKSLWDSDWNKECPEAPMIIDENELKETPVKAPTPKTPTINFEKLGAIARQVHASHAVNWNCNRKGQVMVGDAVVAWGDEDIADYLAALEPCVLIEILDLVKELQDNLADRDARLALANTACEELRQNVITLEARLANANEQIDSVPATPKAVDPLLKEMLEVVTWKVRSNGIIYNFYHPEAMIQWVEARPRKDLIEVCMNSPSDSPWKSFLSFQALLLDLSLSFEEAYIEALTSVQYAVKKARYAAKGRIDQLLETRDYYQTIVDQCPPSTTPYERGMVDLLSKSLKIEHDREPKEELPANQPNHWQLKVEYSDKGAIYHNFYHFDPLLSWVHNSKITPTAVSRDGGETWKDYISFLYYVDNKKMPPNTAFDWADEYKKAPEVNPTGHIRTAVELRTLEKELAEEKARSEHYKTACITMEAEGVETLGRILGMVLTAEDKPEQIGAKPGDVEVGDDTLGSLLDQMEDTFRWRDAEVELPNPEDEVIVKAGAFTHVCQVVLNDGSIKKHPTQGKKFKGAYWLHGGVPFSVTHTRWHPIPKWVELCPHSGHKVLLHPEYGPICNQEGCPCKGLFILTGGK